MMHSSAPPAPASSLSARVKARRKQLSSYMRRAFRQWRAFAPKPFPVDHPMMTVQLSSFLPEDSQHYTQRLLELENQTLCRVLPDALEIVSNHTAEADTPFPGEVVRNSQKAAAQTRYSCSLHKDAPPLSPTDLEQAVFCLEHTGMPAAPLLRQDNFFSKKEAKGPRCRTPGGGLFLPPQQTTPHKPTLLLALGTITDGGGERLTSRIITHMAAEGWRILVVNTGFHPTEDSPPVKWFTAITPEVYHTRDFLPLAEDGGAFVRYLVHSRQVDVLWQAGSAPVYQALAQLREESPHCAVVDILFNTEGHLAANRAQAAYIDHVITESNAVAACLTEQGETRARISTVPSGIAVEPLSASSPSSEQLRRELGIPPDAVVAGFSGRLSPEKAPEVFVEIAAACRDIPQLYFVMTGRGPAESAVQERMAALAPERLFLMGHVPASAPWLAMYDILVVPSRLDGRPLAVMEAMSLGTPCLASDTGGLPELITHGETGLLALPADAAAFAETLRVMAQDRPSLERMGRAAQKTAHEQFDQNIMFRRYSAIFQKLLTTNRSKI